MESTQDKIYESKEHFNGAVVLWRKTLELWAFTAIKSPLMFFIRPLITRLDEGTTSITLRLNRKNKNPYRSMAFGALTSGAETVPCIAIVEFSRNLKTPVSFLAKEFKGKYLHQIDRDVTLVSKDNAAIKKAIGESSTEGITKELWVTVIAIKKGSNEIAAEFKILFSLKAKEAKR